jgi:hypothetical protein
MMCISRLTYWIGDPVTAAATTIAVFLIMSGLGSLTAQNLRTRNWAGLLFPLLVLVAASAVLVLATAATTIVSALTWARLGAGCLTLAPLAFLMGFPMPLALVRLQQKSPELVPWAWGVNGSASVLSAPLAVALSMQFGFLVVGGAAIGFYALAGMTFASVPHHLDRPA